MDILSHSHTQRRGDKPDMKSCHIMHTDTFSEDEGEEIVSGAEGEDEDVDLVTDMNSDSRTDDAIPKMLSPLASVSSGEASISSSVGGAASLPIVKLGLCGHLLTEDPDGMLTVYHS